LSESCEKYSGFLMLIWGGMFALGAYQYNWSKLQRGL
jgi:hypothetical protein